MSSEPTPAFPPGSWVLVTGVIGHIASHVTSQLLQSSYKVRGTVRDLTAASWLVDDLFKHAAVAGKFQRSRLLQRRCKGSLRYCAYSHPK